MRNLMSLVVWWVGRETTRSADSMAASEGAGIIYAGRSGRGACII